MDATAWTPPWWLPGGNAQTIWPALFARTHQGALPKWRRERWSTPDGDFVDVDEYVSERPPADDAPVLVLFHGLEGSSASHYARAFADHAAQRGWRCVVPHFRGCSGEINLAPRAYHSGDHEEVGWILGRLRSRHPLAAMLAVGVSLGGNALMRWAQEAGHSGRSVVAALAAVSSPLDLASAGRAIDTGFNRWVYARMFLRTMRAKAEAKWRQFPRLFDLDAVRRATTLYAFDHVFTAPLHGFQGTDDYWRRAAAKPRLAEVRVPALALNALNDPFVPADGLPRAAAVGRWVTLWQPPHGGHVGFCRSDDRLRFPGHVWGLPEQVCAWLAKAAGVQHG